MDNPPPLPRVQTPLDRPSSLWREAAQEYEPDADPIGPEGLGGWLILVTISLIFGIPFLTYHLFNKWRVFFSPSGVWPRLTTPGSQAYHPLWGPLMVYETTENAVRLCWLIVVAVLFVQRRRLFKPLMIGFHIASAAILWLDFLVARQVTVVRSEHTAQLIGQSIAVALWTWYFLVSDRVKNTFVR